jgi:hypothetical protein
MKYTYVVTVAFGGPVISAGDKKRAVIAAASNKGYNPTNAILWRVEDNSVVEELTRSQWR